MGTFKDSLRTADTTDGLVAGHSSTTGPVTLVQDLKVVGTANAAAANEVIVTNASHGQATTHTIPDSGNAADSFDVSLSSAVATAPKTFVRIITAGQAALASAGTVTVQANTSATSQFAVLDIKVLKSTGLSGGGGDRLLQVTDGTISFNNAGITAAVLGTPITTVWGGTGNPVPATSVDPSASTAGASIVLKYAGGTTDYTAGSVKIAVTLAQVTQ